MRFIKWRFEVFILKTRGSIKKVPSRESCSTSAGTLSSEARCRFSSWMLRPMGKATVITWPSGTSATFTATAQRKKKRLTEAFFFLTSGPCFHGDFIISPVAVELPTFSVSRSSLCVSAWAFGKSVSAPASVTAGTSAQLKHDSAAIEVCVKDALIYCLRWTQGSFSDLYTT